MHAIEPPFPLALMCLKNTLLYSREICKINKRSGVASVKKQNSNKYNTAEQKTVGQGIPAGCSQDC